MLLEYSDYARVEGLPSHYDCAGNVTHSHEEDYRRNLQNTAIFEESCTDTAGTATDSYADGCYWYDSNPDGCGYYDDADFVASQLCCACGGGAAATDD